MSTMYFSPLLWNDYITSLKTLNIRYKMKGQEGKVRNLTNTPGSIRCLDCSGFVQYLIFSTTAGNAKLPQGSVRQRDYLLDHHFPRVNYEVEAGWKDNIVRIAFRDPKRKIVNGVRKKKAGHVWLIYNGFTFECTTVGAGNGPRSLKWDHRLRKNAAKYCFVLGRLPQQFSSSPFNQESLTCDVETLSCEI